MENNNNNNNQQHETQDGEDEIENEEDPQFGFVPMNDPKEALENEKKRKREEDGEEIRMVKQKINRLLCQNPGLRPRSSSTFMEQLKEMDLEKLYNIHENMINDLAALDGYPTADSAIIGTTFYLNTMVPGYMQRCLEDDKLRRDIDIQINQLIGYGHSFLIIGFRFFNNFIKCILPERLLKAPQQPIIPSFYSNQPVTYVNEIIPNQTQQPQINGGENNKS